MLIRRWVKKQNSKIGQAGYSTSSLPYFPVKSMALSSSLWSIKLPFIKLFLSLATIKGVFGNCYTSVFSFGDSLADTGNVYFSEPTSHCLFPPYGETYFHHPSGRCCNGRLVIDFIGEHHVNLFH